MLHWRVRVRVSDAAIVYAHADSYRRINGTWIGTINWSDACTGYLNNCNGNLRCGGC